MKKIILINFFIFLFKTSFGEVTIWVDSNPVDTGEMFNLYIEVKNVNDLEDPDLNSVEGFQIINKSKQNQTYIAGNKINRSVKWTYLMIAKNPGIYQIPSLKIGQENTKPILIKVIKSQNTKQNEIVRLDLDVSSKKVYLHQQVLIKLRIVRNGLQLVNETITPLEIKGAKIEKIKEESFKELEEGKKLLITEILFVVIPEKIGELKIPQIKYQGDEIKGVNLGSIFQKFGSYSQNKGRRIFSKSEIKTIEVSPVPDNFVGWWLPVSKLNLEEKWEKDNIKFVVGEPVTRTISISVQGAYSDQIPELKIKYPNGIKKYSTQPKLKTEKTENGLKGYRIEKYALIPNKEGEIKLPEISIDWWDTTNNQMRKSVIPAKIIEVVGNSSVVKDEFGKITNGFEKNIKENESLNFSKYNEKYKNDSVWKYLTVALSLLWIATFVFWFFYYKLKNKSKNNTIDQEITKTKNLKVVTKRLKLAIENGSPNNLRDELLSWGKTYWESNPPKGLEQIGERMPEIKKGIKTLNSFLYGDTNCEYSEDDIRNEFRGIKLNHPKNKNINKTYLKQIYPGS
tara:strand:- start:835 stop:2538 length:1704 start_codon:yes stop_codon:yes gene_type:complete